MNAPNKPKLSSLIQDSLNPNPSALVESMRSMGYSPHAAMADIVDNSITAGARDIQIDLCPAVGESAGWVRIVDDGQGMDAAELVNAMRWGGAGPLSSRTPNDLGRFGLGLKTASVSLGRRVTVLSRKNGETNAVRWDLDHICASGSWNLLEGIDPADERYLEGINLGGKRGGGSGTIVLITVIDRLRIDGHVEAQRQENQRALFVAMIDHLGLVFHRFLERNLVRVKVGASDIKPWNLFGMHHGEETKWLKSTELLSQGRVRVRSFNLPHYKSMTEEQHQRLGGPRGWTAHQGFMVYRSDRLIVAGGWLGFFRPEEHCKLARISIDLPNDLDGAWGLNVMKSSVRPPAALKGDLERIAAAARSNANATYRFHGVRDATEESPGEQDSVHHAFWKQISAKNHVRFRINRSHPLVEALVQSISNKPFADAFLKAFESLLPVAAILQQPAKSTHGIAVDPTEEDLLQLATALGVVIDVLVKTGLSYDAAKEIALSCQPFKAVGERLRGHLDKKP